MNASVLGAHGQGPYQDVLTMLWVLTGQTWPSSNSDKITVI